MQIQTFIGTTVAVEADYSQRINIHKHSTMSGVGIGLKFSFLSFNIDLVVATPLDYPGKLADDEKKASWNFLVTRAL